MQRQHKTENPYGGRTNGDGEGRAGKPLARDPWSVLLWGILCHTGRHLRPYSDRANPRSPRGDEGCRHGASWPHHGIHCHYHDIPRGGSYPHPARRNVGRFWRGAVVGMAGWASQVGPMVWTWDAPRPGRQRYGRTVRRLHDDNHGVRSAQ